MMMLLQTRRDAAVLYSCCDVALPQRRGGGSPTSILQICFATCAEFPPLTAGHQLTVVGRARGVRRREGGGRGEDAQMGRSHFARGEPVVRNRLVSCTVSVYKQPITVCTTI
jgi:hypothetical protein